MAKNFRICSAPRASDGRYRFTNGDGFQLKDFSDQDSMLSYWDERIVPSSCTTFGLEYEVSMVEMDDSDWDFVGDPRYSNNAVL